MDELWKVQERQLVPKCRNYASRPSSLLNSEELLGSVSGTDFVSAHAQIQKIMPVHWLHPRAIMIATLYDCIVTCPGAPKRLLECLIFHKSLIRYEDYRPHSGSIRFSFSDEEEEVEVSSNVLQCMFSTFLCSLPNIERHQNFRHVLNTKALGCSACGHAPWRLRSCCSHLLCQPICIHGES